MLQDFVEDLSYHLFRLIVACFDVFGTDSVAVCRYAFLSLLIAVSNSSVAISGILIISLVSLFLHIDAAFIFILFVFSFSFFVFLVVA